MNKQRDGMLTPLCEKYKSKSSFLKVDTFEARADCRANELTLTRGRERTVQDSPCTLLHGPIGRFLIGLS